MNGPDSRRDDRQPARNAYSYNSVLGNNFDGAAAGNLAELSGAVGSYIAVGDVVLMQTSL
jgi:hypothetical protein